MTLDQARPKAELSEGRGRDGDAPQPGPSLTIATEDGATSVIQPYAYQRLMATNAARFAMYEWSRQSGKSMGSALLVNLDILEAEAAGRRTLWTVISRSLLQARELTRKVRDVGRAVMAARNMLKGIEESESKDELGETTLELTYPGGSRVIVVSGNPDAAAGYTGNVLWDEVGLTKKARDLFGTAFPVVSRRRPEVAGGGYRFVMTSTPRPGFWVKRWEEAQKDGSAWFTHHLTIHDAIAQGCPMDAEELQRGLNDDLLWRQEYLCEHVDDDICWIPWELIVNSTDDSATMGVGQDLQDRKKKSNPVNLVNPVYAGWDVARWQHLSVLWLAEKLGNRFRTCGVIAMKRMPFDAQLLRVRDTLKRFPRFTRLCIDATGMGEMVAEQAKKMIPGRVEAVKFTGAVKEVIAGDVRRVMEERNFLIPDDDAVRADFHSIHRTLTAAGNPRFEGETEGTHADYFWGAGLCLHAGLKHKGANLYFV